MKHTYRKGSADERNIQRKLIEEEDMCTPRFYDWDSNQAQIGLTSKIHKLLFLNPSD